MVLLPSLGVYVVARGMSDCFFFVLVKWGFLNRGKSLCCPYSKCTDNILGGEVLCSSTLLNWQRSPAARFTVVRFSFPAFLGRGDEWAERNATMGKRFLRVVGGRMRQVPRSGAPGAPAHCCKDAGDARSRPGAVTAALNGYCAASQSSAAEGAAGAR